MDSKYQSLHPKPYAADLYDNSSLFKHKNAGTIRRQKLLKLTGLVCFVLIALGSTFYRIIKDNTRTDNLTQQNVFHLLSTRNSAKIYMWDISGDNTTLLLQNHVAFSEDVGNPVSCDSNSFELCLKWEKENRPLNGAKLTLKKFHLSDGIECHKFNISAPWFMEFSSCISIAGEHLYGGPVMKRYQSWPSEQNEMRYAPRATGQGALDGIVESYWLTSGGKVVYVPRDVPLFISQENQRLCLHSKFAAPYRRCNETRVTLKVYYCQNNNIRKLHTAATRSFLGVPSGVPDKRMIQYPVWSTWARYKRNVNSSIITDFANEIVRYGFNSSQLELDDRWETCYGEFEFDKKKFPNPKELFQQLKNRGFRITLWAHPFIGTLCPAYSEAKSKNYLVKSLNGKLDSTVWWNGIAGLVDFTNSKAASWWNMKVGALNNMYGIDGFKFDAGETSYMPGSPDVGSLQSPTRLQPNIYSTRYVENAALLSRNEKISEFRVMFMNQGLPVFLRMSDRESSWGYNSGLKSLIPTLLALNTVGYSFILPDMIGGNGYGNSPSKELFIRWLQACTFMPSLQFSYAPWDYDNETIEIAKKFTSLHEEYADQILGLADQKVINGTPINLPIWWLDPSDKTALEIDSEYLLGEDLLVAPILEEGAVIRDIYLPTGTWQQKVRSGAFTNITGPAWVREYEVQLDELAFFIRVS